MNSIQQAQRAYASVHSPSRSARRVEYEAVARISHRLKAAAERGRAGFTELVEALHDNRRLWTIFAADVASPENALPQDLRAQIFYLAEFTQIHTSRVLAREADIRPLLEINAAILRGLKTGAHTS